MRFFSKIIGWGLESFPLLLALLLVFLLSRPYHALFREGVVARYSFLEDWVERGLHSAGMGREAEPGKTVLDRASSSPADREKLREDLILQALARSREEVRQLRQYAAPSWEQGVTAKILFQISPDAFFQRWIVDGGSKEGIVRGEPVFVSPGSTGSVEVLAGVVDQSTAHYAWIQPLTDASFLLPVFIQEKGEIQVKEDEKENSSPSRGEVLKGILKGGWGGYLLVVWVPKKPVSPGAFVYTDKNSPSVGKEPTPRWIPTGALVGTVVRSLPQDDRHQQLVVQPYFTLEPVDFVHILKISFDRGGAK